MTSVTCNAEFPIDCDGITCYICGQYLGPSRHDIYLNHQNHPTCNNLFTLLQSNNTQTSSFFSTIFISFSNWLRSNTTNTNIFNAYYDSPECDHVIPWNGEGKYRWLSQTILNPNNPNKLNNLFANIFINYKWTHPKCNRLKSNLIFIKFEDDRWDLYGDAIRAFRNKLTENIIILNEISFNEAFTLIIRILNDSIHIENTNYVGPMTRSRAAALLTTETNRILNSYRGFTLPRTILIGTIGGGSSNTNSNDNDYTIFKQINNIYIYIINKIQNPIFVFFLKFILFTVKETSNNKNNSNTKQTDKYNSDVKLEFYKDVELKYNLIEKFLKNNKNAEINTFLLHIIDDYLINNKNIDVNLTKDQYINKLISRFLVNNTNKNIKLDGGFVTKKKY